MKIKLLSAVAALALSGPALAQTTAPAPSRTRAPAMSAPAMSAAAPNDYAQPATWLCRPGAPGACAQDQTATVAAASGRLTREAYTPAAAPKIDCFYVYPTVSTDTTPNSDMTADPAEQRVVEQQFARFGAVCRQFAPLYRQVTLTALRANMLAPGSVTADRDLAYRDVRDAWTYYLTHDNGGRGVVLIGHSQGSGVLTRLIKEEIDGKPVERRMISAILAGTSLPPASSSAQMAFKSTPPCASSRQLGCVIAFASFRVDSPPPANSRFGRVQGGSEPAVCVNPAALGGGEGPLDAYLSTRVAIAESAEAPPPWVKGGAAISTPFVKVPGLLTARCVNSGGFDYLAVTTHGDPAGPRTDAITGDVVAGGVTLKDWGLHLIDMNLTMGNLIGIVRDESAAYLARR